MEKREMVKARGRGRGKGRGKKEKESSTAACSLTLFVFIMSRHLSRYQGNFLPVLAFSVTCSGVERGSTPAFLCMCSYCPSQDTVAVLPLTVCPSFLASLLIKSYRQQVFRTSLSRSVLSPILGFGRPNFLVASGLMLWFSD